MNIETITTIIQTLAVIAAAFYLILRICATGKTNTAAAQAEQQRLEELLDSVLLAFITQAEKAYGGGTGKLKLSEVLGKLAALVPDKWKTIFGLERLQSLAEAALQRAKELWQANPALLGVGSSEDTE